MKKIIFKASEGKAANLVNLMKEANKISCRIQIDFVEKIVLVYDIEDADVPNILDLVMSSYEITWVYMDNLESSNEVTADSDIIDHQQNSTETKVKSQTETEEIQRAETDETSKAESTETKKVIKAETTGTETVSKTKPAETAGVSEVEATVKSKALSKKANATKTLTIEKVIKEALNKLDSTKKPDEQIETFLEDIGMPKTEMIKYAFTVALDMPKITFEEVASKVSEKYPKWKETDIKQKLRKAFKNWIEKNPELAENYSRSSLVSIIKLFVKNVK